MSRPLRITYPGAFYHITARGNEQKAVFRSKRDREKFIKGRKAGKDLPALNALADRISIDDIHKAVESAYHDDPVLERNIKI